MVIPSSFGKIANLLKLDLNVPSLFAILLLALFSISVPASESEFSLVLFVEETAYENPKSAIVERVVKAHGAGLATIYSNEQSKEDLAMPGGGTNRQEYPIRVSRESLDRALITIVMMREDLHVSVMYSAISSLGLSQTPLSANGLRAIYNAAPQLGMAIADKEVKATPEILRDIFLSDPEQARDLYEKGTMVNPDMKDLSFRHRVINSNVLDIRYRVLGAIQRRGPSGFKDLLLKAATDISPTIARQASTLLSES